MSKKPTHSPLSVADIETRLPQAPGWAYTDGSLTKTYKRSSFADAIAFIVQIGFLSEKLNHHATITNTYTQVTLTIHTHEVGGVTPLDFEWVQGVEAL